MNERNAERDEDAAQNDGPANAPQERRVLTMCRDAEALKENEEDEKIVDAERGLNGVAGDKLERGLATLEPANPYGEGRRRPRNSTAVQIHAAECVCLASRRCEGSIASTASNTATAA